MITPGQCLEARELLGWSRYRLVPLCGLSHASILQFEMGVKLPKSESLAAIQHALEEAGVEFIPESGGGPGVRLRMRA